MNTSFYNLDKKPFEINPDPSFLWLGEKHKEALATLRYGILDNKGFVLLTGDAGCGKTILIKALTQSLDKSVLWSVIADPSLERVDFYNAIAKGFGIKQEFASKVQFLIQFSRFLHMAADENKKVLLLIDDCHRLSQEMLEELRLLSNIEKADAKLINIFFVGQPEFNDLLLEPRNRAVRHRLTLMVDLRSLDVNETDEYIRHRLKIAGTEEKLFTTKAVQVVQRYSQGVPRLINTICDLALINGSIQTKQIINNRMIESCVRKMVVPVSSHQEVVQTNSDGKNLSKTAKNILSIFGFNLEGGYQHSWLKYGFGLLVLLVVGVYFGYPKPHSLEKVKVAHVEIVKKPVMQSLPQVSSSPAVTMLEKNKREISEKKAADLKNAILEKTNNNNEIKEEAPAGANTRTVKIHQLKEQTPAGVAAPAAAKPQAKDETLAKAAAPAVAKPQAKDEIAAKAAAPAVAKPQAKDETPAKTAAPASAKPQAKEETSAGAKTPTVERHQHLVIKAIKKLKLHSGQKISDEVEDIQPDAQKKLVAVRMVPMMPRKIRLGLEPNSQNLTSEAQKEFDRFVQKLKKYPRATMLIKGFVSAKTNSPKNIELSKERALIVQKLMLAKGIDAEQIEVAGMGNQEPIASNDTSEGQRENRRVEIVIINDGVKKVEGE
jgi:type II secretory pathway predicted ATPase ExeA/outer membrane protein OmpA-like peptidoglycan-associated protein